MTIEEYIAEMGTTFRGLWRSYYLDKFDEPNITNWTVTFIYKGHYVETPDSDTPVAALAWALNKIRGE